MLRARRIWTLRTCTAIVAGTLATVIAATVGLVTLDHLLGVDFDTIETIFGHHGK